MQANDTNGRWMNGRTDGWMDKWTDRRMDRRTDGRTDGRMDGRTDGKSPHSTGLRPLLGLLPKKSLTPKFDFCLKSD